MLEKRPVLILRSQVGEIKKQCYSSPQPEQTEADPSGFETNLFAIKYVDFATKFEEKPES
jgi:hypothetical protein